MKKFTLVCAGLAVAMALTSCGSKESAYKKAYEKAKAQEAQQAVQTQTVTETPVVAPVTTTQGTETVVTDNYDNVSVRPESLTVVDGSGLKSYSVVLGSFSVKANAEGLCQRLRNAGHSAQIAYNSSNGMYRVVASTYDDKASAVRSRNEFRKNADFKDAWLLFNQR
ncbi:MAG: SPOR domain-containing protein [Prevotella sp.]|nr:SPOR domain-containing protein [Prevotella sp.]